MTVTRLLVVRPGTLALVLTADALPLVRHPGDLLVPPLLAATDPEVVVLPVSSQPVELDVTVPEVTTFDGHVVDRVVLRLTLRLDPDGGYAALRELAAEHGPEFEAAVLAAVQQEVTAAVRGVVRVNRLADLERLDLADVLERQWLSPRLGTQTLRRERLRVQRVHWRDAEDEATVPLPKLTG